MRRGSVVALLAVVGPGVLAGLSDDDPAGITTYWILFLSQALNAVLLLVLLPLMRHLARDPAVMGPHVTGRATRPLTALALALVAMSVSTLTVLTVA